MGWSRRDAATQCGGQARTSKFESSNQVADRPWRVRSEKLETGVSNESFPALCGLSALCGCFGLQSFRRILYCKGISQPQRGTEITEHTEIGRGRILSAEMQGGRTRPPFFFFPQSAVSQHSLGSEDASRICADFARDGYNRCVIGRQRHLALILFHVTSILCGVLLIAVADFQSRRDQRIELLGHLFIPRADCLDVKPLGGYHPMSSYSLPRIEWVLSGCYLFQSFWFLMLIDQRIVAAARKRSQAQKRNRGLCVACGYDLRATPDRCPECGTPVGGLNQRR